MKIAFCDFWPDFQPHNNFFVHAISRIAEGVQVTAPKDCDILFFSVFGHENNQYKHCKRVLYTGENIPYTPSVCDFWLGFHEDGDKNARLPLWYLYIDWFNVVSYGNPNWIVPREWLSEHNPNLYKTKTKTIATVFSNPIPNRLMAVNKLSYHFNERVEGRGKPFKMPLEGAEKGKIDFLSDYKYSICFENSIGQGYVTEKYLHARVCGSIPIYWGAKEVTDDFNHVGVFFNGHDWLDLCLKIDAYNPELIKQPILKQNDLHKAYKALKRAIA